MDVIRFHDSSPGKMDQGEIVNGLKSKMWIERYSKEGEFTFTGPANSDIREKLPIGAFISHTNSSEIMQVENHEISDSQDSESDIIITGRGFETFLENRIVGSNKTFPVLVTPDYSYSLPDGYTWNQAAQLILDHILASTLIDDDNALPFVTALSTVPGSYVAESGAVSSSRPQPRGPLYDRVIELLSIDNLGIKIIRPTGLSLYWPNVAIIIHVGTNRTGEVIFSYDTGEIVSADYLWSNKNLKNAALVTGKWIETVVIPEQTGYERRWMHIDASDIDQGYDALLEEDVAIISAAMHQRGLDILSAQKDIALTKAEVSKDATKAMFRYDFDVGDIITVSGDYNETSSMRISEYVEIEDETGERGYPTLSMD